MTKNPEAKSQFLVERRYSHPGENRPCMICGRPPAGHDHKYRPFPPAQVFYPEPLNEAAGKPEGEKETDGKTS